RKLYLIPGIWQIISEFFYTFIFSIIKQQAGIKAVVYFPIFFSTFFFILLCNLIGLIPFGFAVTGQFVITLSLAFSFNVGFVFFLLFLVLIIFIFLLLFRFFWFLWLVF